MWMLLDLSLWNYFQNNHLNGPDCLGNEVALRHPSSLSFSLLKFFSGPLKGSGLSHRFLCDSGKSVTHSGPISEERQFDGMILDAQASSEVWSVLFLHERA